MDVERQDIVPVAFTALDALDVICGPEFQASRGSLHRLMTNYSVSGLKIGLL
jgi:hypothetical protein